MKSHVCFIDEQLSQESTGNKLKDMKAPKDFNVKEIISKLDQQQDHPPIKTSLISSLYQQVLKNRASAKFTVKLADLEDNTNTLIKTEVDANERTREISYLPLSNDSDVEYQSKHITGYILYCP